jgi:6-phosphogluconate dehydrogenase
MELGIIGLGRMGLNMAMRLLRGGHKVVGYALSVKSVKQAEEKGVAATYSLKELMEKLTPPRVVWLMIPAGDPIDKTILGLLPEMETGDIIIDGGNSNYRDTLRHYAMLKERGIHFVDVGTSGGILGIAEGYSMMVGGEKDVVERLRPIFETLAPAQDKGWGHVGPSGAGHFVKMVHNGIEYGLMQAYAEGFALLKRKEKFKLDLHQVADIWRYGSVIRSWLLDLTSQALSKDQELSDVAPYVADSGEGRWTVFEAIDLDLDAPVITLSLLQRLRSRDEESFSDRLLAVMRQKFGGHSIKR